MDVVVVCHRRRQFALLFYGIYTVYGFVVIQSLIRRLSSSIGDLNVSFAPCINHLYSTLLVVQVEINILTKHDYIIYVHT